MNHQGSVKKRLFPISFISTDNQQRSSDPNKESIMEQKGLTGGLYQPLSSADIETIHQTSLTILENTGISYESDLEETIDMLEAQGAKADRKRARVFFPEDLVETQAAKAPERVNSVQP